MAKVNKNILELGCTRQEMAAAVTSKIRFYGARRDAVARRIGIGVSTLRGVESSKNVHPVTAYLVRQWVNKKGL